MASLNMALDITSSLANVEGIFVQRPIFHTIFTLINSSAVLALTKELGKPLKEALQDIAKQDLVTYIQTMQRLRSGEALKELEEYEEAIEVFKEVIKIQPRNHKAWLLRSICLLLLGELERADRSFDRTLEKKQIFEPYYYKSLIALLQDRAEDALRDIDNALAFNDCRISEVWHDRARILEKLNRFEEASDAYDKAIRLEPNNHAAKINRSLLHTIEYKTTEDFIEKASVLLIRKSFEDGIAYIDRAIEKSPASFEAWRLRGHLERSSKNYLAAVQAYKKAIDIQEKSAESFHGLGVSLFKIKKFQSSSKALMRALELGHDEKEIWLYYGLCKYNLNHCRKALHGFSKVCETWPTSIIGHLLKGHTFRKRGDYENALRSYHTVLKKRPGHLEAIACIAKIHYLSDELDEALNFYEQVQEINPGTFYYCQMVNTLEREIQRRREEKLREEEARWEEECRERRRQERERQAELREARRIQRQREPRRKWLGIF